MTEPQDYLETLGARIRAGGTGCGIRLKDHGGALFQDIDIAELRSRLNEAMHFTVTHYTDCIARAGVEFTRSPRISAGFIANQSSQLITRFALPLLRK
jgi:hypothetical protein